MARIERNVANKQRTTRYKEYLDSVESFWDTPPITNPYAQARHLLDLTLVEAASATGVSKQALIRLEQGVPDKPIGPVTSYYVGSLYRHEGYDYLDFINGYEQYQVSQRQRNYKLFGDRIPLGTSFRYDVHTLTQLLAMWCFPVGNAVGGSLNPTECAKLLCINQSILDHWVNKPHRQQSVPTAFMEALRTNGYRQVDLQQVIDAYEIHRAYLTGGEVLAAQRSKDLTPKPSLKGAIFDELGIK